MFQIRLLGPPEIRCSGAMVRGFESRKALALLCYLAATAQAQRRDFLADLFWPDLKMQRARGNLSRVLHNLSRLLPEVIDADRWSIGVTTGSHHWIDTVRFQELAALKTPESLAASAALVRGEFLADLDVDECPGFSLWQIHERQRWNSRASEVILHLLDHYQDAAMPEEGIAIAHRLVALDPWHEHGRRTLMRLLAETGQRAAALDQYETFRTELEDDVGIEPAAETTALYQQIMRDEGVARRTPTMPTPPPGNIPPSLTSFVGREDELRLVAERLEDAACRILTIVGAGGSGKTRLALEAARRASHRYRHGCWLVELAPVFEPEMTATAIASSVGCEMDGPDPPSTQLMRFLAPRQMLLILDNFEHLLPAAELVLEISRHAPLVTIVVTSRDRLGFQAEWLIPLSGMAVIPPNGGSEAQYAEALRLFWDRSRQVLPTLRVEETANHLATSLCRSLEGMPLAIELAAARMAEYSIEEIAESVDANLDALSVELADMPPRHRSLRAVFDHSWRLLSEPERSLLARLTVFRGGCDRHAADAIAGATEEVLDALERHSLLLHEADGRYALHEQVRQFAAEKLGNDTDDTRERHARYYNDLAQEADAALTGPEQSLWLERLGRDVNNIRAALDWIHAKGDLDAAMGFAAALWRYWLYRGHFTEGIERIDTLLTSASELPPTRNHALALNVAGILSNAHGDSDKAHHRFHAALEMWRQLESEAGIANALNNLGVFVDSHGDAAAAMRYYEESLALRRKLDLPQDVAVSLNNLAVALIEVGRPERATDLLKESLAIKRTFGDLRGTAMSLANLGNAAVEAGDPEAALPYLNEGIRLCWELDDLPDLAEQLLQLTRACAASGRFRPAVVLAAAQQALREHADAPIAPADLADFEAALAAAQDRLGKPDAERAWAEGLALAPPEAVEYALEISS